MNLPKTRVEFYDAALANKGERAGLAFIPHAMFCPPVGARVNIKRQDYMVSEVTFSVDHSESSLEICLRANVMLKPIKPKKRAKA